MRVPPYLKWKTIFHPTAYTMYKTMTIHLTYPNSFTLPLILCIERCPNFTCLSKRDELLDIFVTLTWHAACCSHPYLIIWSTTQKFAFLHKITDHTGRYTKHLLRENQVPYKIYSRIRSPTYKSQNRLARKTITLTSFSLYNQPSKTLLTPVGCHDLNWDQDAALRASSEN